MEELRRLLAALDRDGDPAPADDIAFRIEALDRIDACLPHADEALRSQALAASDRLESLNARFFESLREDIRSGLGPERLMACLARWEPPRAHADDPQAYDLLDELVAGLLRIGEPAADLAIALALQSATTGVPLPPDLVVCGEVGLGGEVRQVNHLGRRLNEAARMGFHRAVVPRSAPEGPAGITLLRASTVAEAAALATG